ncbi:MAG: FAD-binding protein, partial [Microcoleaceae cyanobacterium]
NRTDLALYEFTWNDTTLYARKTDNSLTYLQILFPTGLDLVQKIALDYQDEMIMHLEFFRVDGKVTPAALPIVKYTSEARLNEIIADLETQGAIVFNPHTYVLEDGGMKTINIDQLRFKAKVDPYGLLNPGKMRAWYERANILS